MHHYITKYEEDGVKYAESWIQFNLFNKCFCFSKKTNRIVGGDRHGSDENDNICFNVKGCSDD